MLEWLKLSRIGLMYDITGACIVVFSQLRIGARELKEAELFWRSHIDERNLRLARNDSVWGFSLLLIGFLLQLLGSDQKLHPLDSCAMFLLGVALVLLIGGYCVMRARVFSDYRKRVVEEQRTRQTQTQKKNSNSACS